MADRSIPGVSREERISDDGLLRLDKQLKTGSISAMVLKQWIKRYGDSARSLIKKYGRYESNLES